MEPPEHATDQEWQRFKEECDNFGIVEFKNVKQWVTDLIKGETNKSFTEKNVKKRLTELRRRK